MAQTESHEITQTNSENDDQDKEPIMLTENEKKAKGKSCFNLFIFLARRAYRSMKNALKILDSLGLPCVFLYLAQGSIVQGATSSAVDSIDSEEYLRFQAKFEEVASADDPEDITEATVEDIEKVSILNINFEIDSNSNEYGLYSKNRQNIFTIL